MPMFEQEIRLGSWVSVLLVLTWSVTGALLISCILTDEWDLGFGALCCSALGAALLVIRDNCKTRRVIRAMARELPATVRPLRSE